jgi:uncharacterized membrane protein
MTGLFRPLASAALAGAATGARSFTGLAALTLAARRDAGTQPDRSLGRPWVKTTASALAVQECVLDKLPGVPSRLAAPGLVTRLAGAGVSAVVIVRRTEPDHAHLADVRGDAGVPGQQGIPDPDARASAAPGAAAATAWAGTRWRAWASERLGRDWIAAGIEDAAAFALAAAAVLAARKPRP